MQWLLGRDVCSMDPRSLLYGFGQKREVCSMKVRSLLYAPEKFALWTWPANPYVAVLGGLLKCFISR